MGLLGVRHQRPEQRSRQALPAHTVKPMPRSSRRVSASSSRWRVSSATDSAGRAAQGTQRSSFSVSRVTRATPSRRSKARAPHRRDRLSTSDAPNDETRRPSPVFADQQHHLARHRTRARPGGNALLRRWPHRHPVGAPHGEPLGPARRSSGTRDTGRTPSRGTYEIDKSSFLEFSALPTPAAPPPMVQPRARTCTCQPDTAT